MRARQLFKDVYVLLPTLGCLLALSGVVLNLTSSRGREPASPLVSRELSPRDDDPDSPEPERFPVIFAGPKALPATGEAPSMADPALSASHPYQALAYYYLTEIFHAPSRHPRVIGYARRGARLAARGPVGGSGCRHGRWYPVAGGGYVCTRAGFGVSRTRRELDLHRSLPDTSRPVPFRYAKVTSPEALRLFRLPTAEELEQMTGGDGLPEVVERQMKGVFFLALHQPVTHLERAFYLTAYGRYVLEENLRIIPPYTMHGELLNPERSLPLAFVYGEDRPVFKLEDGVLQQVGVAEKHARFPVARVLEHREHAYVLATTGHVLRREDVRVASLLRRPPEIRSGEKWIHVDLSQQTLVAYRGDRPIFATVVSSGREGYEPPQGLFRIVQKYVSVTMNGPDPDEGFYEVEEVPWTMYYWEGFALHGAYWHNDFGKPRSHGCTNLAPADARWLFQWTSPSVPRGWQAKISKGTWIKCTD